MKYLLFDTNIYLDMIVNRRKNVHYQLIQTFIKLLEFEEVKLILPDIVDYETKKHIEEEIDKVGIKIKSTIDQIEEIYWIVGINDTEIDIETQKRSAIKPLRQSVDTFNANRISYANQLNGLINQLFSYRTTIRIESDHNLLNLVMKRKIFKRAPFHKESKESYADALITEMLINIKKYITLDPDDKVFFVTGNKDDFSDSDDKTKLHNHITEELKLVELEDKVVYSTIFSKLIKKELSEEVEKANLSEEFSHELDIIDYDFQNDIEDRKRESVGLPSLSCYPDIIDTTLREDSKANVLNNLFDSLRSEFCALEEIYNDYDVILEFIENEIAYSDRCSQYLESINDLLVDNGLDIQLTKFSQVLAWIRKNQDKLILEGVSDLPEYFSLDESITIFGFSGNYQLYWKDNTLDPANGEIDQLICELKKDDQIIAKGYIDINYGYPPEDDDGNVGECSLDSVTLNFDHICERISLVNDEIAEQRKGFELLRDIFMIAFKLDAL